jgi:hypothetical protein
MGFGIRALLVSRALVVKIKRLENQIRGLGPAMFNMSFLQCGPRN